jgi:ABC-2 type transport system ATP-binding protein
MTAIRIDGITKSFGGRPALHPLQLEVQRGELFGLLGHNGAGKSTTFGILLGQVRPDAGEAFLNGHPVQTARSLALRKVGAIFEAPAFYEYLSGWKNLEIFTAYSARVPRTEMEEVVELVGLRDRIRDPVRNYSHGMRQRLGLAQALLPAPEIILLDEPTEGLDPEGIHEMRHLILRLREERGLTVLLSSHLLSEVEQLCDRVAILNQGHLVYCGAWQENAAPRVRIDVDDQARAASILQPMNCRLENGVVTLPLEIDPADVLAALVHAGIRVRAFAPERRSLEDFYLGHIAQ